MTTTLSQGTLDQLGRLIEKACENGDNVSAIARRANVNRNMVSQLRNGTCEMSPTTEKVDSILHAIGRPMIGDLLRELE